jgi:hypothetical protein
MQSIVNIGRIQSGRTRIQLVGLEAISGAMGAFGGPKDAGGLLGGPEERPKGQ